MHDIGAIVVCTSLSPENVEGLILGEDYQVKGHSTHEGNLVYSVEDWDGKMFYSTDHFRTIKQGGKQMEAKEIVFQVVAVSTGEEARIDIVLNEGMQMVGLKAEDVLDATDMLILEAMSVKLIEALITKMFRG